NDQLSSVVLTATPSLLTVVTALFAALGYARVARWVTPLLVLFCLAGGLLAVVLVPGHDAKWFCIWAGAGSAAAALVTAIAAWGGARGKATWSRRAPSFRIWQGKSPRDVGAARPC